MFISTWECSHSMLDPDSVPPAKTTDPSVRLVNEFKDDSAIVTHATDSICNQIRIAFDLNRVFTETKYSSSIGHCLTRYEQQDPPLPEQQVILTKMRDIHRHLPTPYKYGLFEESFYLKITRPGCEFDDIVEPRSYAIDKLLPEWFEHAEIAGYGDLKALRKRSNRDIQNAKEITADKFTVRSALLDRIRATWGEYLIPGAVRVEPYKIYLYGPGGYFKSQRHTPEQGLVGMFLVGLGDTSARSVYESGRRRYEGNFCIGEEKLAAKSCSWVAFHPDVPHSVSKLSDHGYRAVIAFKLFHDTGSAKLEEAARELMVRNRVSDVLADIPVPYGFLLDLQYHMDISRLNGFDAILLSAAQQRQNTAVHILPVIIRSHSTIFFKHRYDGEKDYYRALVYPFTSAHLDQVLSNGENTEAEKRAGWFKEIKDIPFYSLDFDRSAAQWRRITEEIHYAGNESDGTREDSIYISYALVVMADNHNKRDISWPSN